MTREEARKAAEVLNAYARGESIEVCKRNSSKWFDINMCYEKPYFNWYENEYRVKKETTYRPFKNKEECWEEMQKHQPFGWIKTGGSFLNIVEIYDTHTIIGDTKGIVAWQDMLKDYQFADGTPFGIKEE